MPWYPLIFPLVALAILAAIVFWRRSAERQRTEEVASVAATMGFAFDAESRKPAEAGMLPAMAGFALFRHGGAPRVRNVMRMRVIDGEDLVFDYRYTVSTGKSSHTVEQTVAAFHRPGTTRPAFSLSPEHVFSKLGHLFGGQDIDFDSNDAFSSAYVLKGEDEDAIRRLFERQAVIYFADRPGWSAEARGEWLVIYGASKRPKPEDLREWIEEVRRAARVFDHR